MDDSADHVVGQAAAAVLHELEKRPGRRCPGCGRDIPRNRSYCSNLCAQTTRGRRVQTSTDLRRMVIEYQTERQPARNAAIYLIFQPKGKVWQ